jgi:hypothetical protein
MDEHAAPWSTHYFKHIQTDESGVHTGREITVAGGKFRPLQYSHLQGINLRDPLVIHTFYDDGEVIESSDPGKPAGTRGCFEFTVETPYSTMGLALVRGGWLPVGMAISEGTTILLDRCVVSNLSRRFNAGKKVSEEDKDFLDFFCDTNIRLNPMLFALEGNGRKIPSSEEIESQLDEAYKKIRHALPSAQLMPPDKTGLKGVVGIVQDTTENIERATKFLVNLSRKYFSPVSAKRLPNAWRDVLDAATEFGLTHKSLVVLAALSAITVPLGKSPAKSLLKWRPGYSNGDAYNALADLRALDVLIHLFALFPDEDILLCTSDQDLCLFWSGIGASEFSLKSGVVTYKMSLVESLIPGMDHALRSLFEGD